MRRFAAAAAAYFLLAAAAPALAAQQEQSLAEEMQEAAAQVRATLPIRTDSITQAVGIRAEGTEFVYDMAVSEEIPASRLQAVNDAVQASNQSNLCSDPGINAFIRRGGSMRHIYTDTAGHRFETRVASCP